MSNDPISTILVAEDNMDSRQLVEDVLRSAGYNVLTAVDGEEALEIVQAERPDLIILDVNMPGMTGFEVCARIKGNESLSNIPVLMLTALSDVGHRVEGLSCGADDYLPKPFSPRELLARVDARLRAKQASDELLIAQQQIRATFERFVAPEVVEQLLANPSAVKLGGRLQNVTVMFTDLAGFTAISERAAPERVLDVLNGYLSLIAGTIKSHGGTIDKYMGDGVMALFNAPLPQEDHALRAVRAALAIRDELPDFHRQFDPTFRVGIHFGIHTGKAVVGNVGTPEFMNFTAIGDAVNLASRLQGASEPNQILITEDTYELVKREIAARKLGPYRFKGRSGRVPVYEVIGLTE